MKLITIRPNYGVITRFRGLTPVITDKRYYVIDGNYGYIINSEILNKDTIPEYVHAIYVCNLKDGKEYAQFFRSLIHNWDSTHDFTRHSKNNHVIYRLTLEQLIEIGLG